MRRLYIHDLYRILRDKPSRQGHKHATFVSLCMGNLFPKKRLTHAVIG